MPVREGLVRIEARGIAGRPRLDRRPGISGMKRGFAVPGAIDPVRDIPTAQHRDRSLNDSHVHVLENARQGTAIAAPEIGKDRDGLRSEEHTSELQSLMRISYAVFFLKNKK